MIGRQFQDFVCLNFCGFREGVLPAPLPSNLSTCRNSN
jgi:hypothetical protein